MIIINVENITVIRLKIFCDIINVFTGTLEKLNTSFLNKSHI